jgi:hypothetical protein
MPELFGNPYILPAILAIVVLLGVLVLLRLRGRKSAGASGKEGVPAKKAGKERAPATKPGRRGREAAVTGEASTIAAMTPGPSSQAVPTDTVVAVAPPEFRPSPAAPAPQAAQAQPVSREGTLPSTDPLTAVITNILQGWGDLTAEDTNRLEVFRRDKVLAAIAAIELPKDLKSSEYARSRLGQLRHYAAYLEHGEQRPERAEFAAIGHGPTVAPMPTPGPEPDFTAATGAEGTAGEMQPPGPVTQAKDELYDTEESAAEVRLAESRWGSEKPADLWGAETVEAAVETPKVAEAAVDLWATEAPDAQRTTEAAVAAAAAAFWARPEAPKQPQANITQQVESPPALELPTVDDLFAKTIPPAAGSPVSAGSLASLHQKVSTAEDLMALPAGEQTDVVAFLEPGELDKVFRVAQDPNLKRTVIDTLEHIGSPAALEVLRQCLDDPDPEIQIHALDAADRLLGVD